MLIDTQKLDWFFVCSAHLTDRGFANRKDLSEKDERDQRSTQASATISANGPALLDESKTVNTNDQPREEINEGSEKLKGSVGEPRTHEHYQLHRSIFQMRIDARGRRMGTGRRTKILDDLPAAPRGMPQSK